MRSKLVGRTIVVVVFFAAVALLLGGCGGKGDNCPTPTSPGCGTPPEPYTIPAGGIVYHRISVDNPGNIGKKVSLGVRQEGVSGTTLLDLDSLGGDRWTYNNSMPGFQRGVRYEFWVSDPVRGSASSGTSGIVARDLAIPGATVVDYNITIDPIWGKSETVIVMF